MIQTLNLSGIITNLIQGGFCIRTHVNLDSITIDSQTLNLSGIITNLIQGGFCIRTHVNLDRIMNYN